MKKIIVCVNYRANPDQPSCAARGSKEIAKCLQAEISKRKLGVMVEQIHCMGFCDKGPNVRLVPGGRFFHELTLQDIPQVMTEIEQFLLDQP
jgi:NADH:ubiquinone oxidoreductase subunit E